MNPMTRTVAVFAFLLAAGGANAAPASEASIRQLLEVSQARALVDSMRGQFDGMMTKAVQQSLKGKTPTPRQQQAINAMKEQVIALVSAQVTWPKLEPMYVRLYQETFTEDEVQGMVAFYRSPAGQAMVQKMPLLMQKSIAEMQRIMLAMMPKMEEIERKFEADMAAAGK